MQIDTPNGRILERSRNKIAPDSRCFVPQLQDEAILLVRHGALRALSNVITSPAPAVVMIWQDDHDATRLLMNTLVVITNPASRDGVIQL